MIVAVRDAAPPQPPGFDPSTPTLRTQGSVYRGLIDLHSHLAYNALRLWPVTRAYANRDQWAGTPSYQQLISGPMKLIGSRPELLSALVRYVEANCLVAGTTTTQGVALFSAPGIRHYYRGIVRNVEQTNENVLPEAVDRIPAVPRSLAAAKTSGVNHRPGRAKALNAGDAPRAQSRDNSPGRIPPDHHAPWLALAAVEAALDNHDLAQLYGFRGRLVAPDDVRVQLDDTEH